MGPRISAARKQLETRIRNDEIYRESERKLAKDFKRQIDNWWRLHDEVCGKSSFFETPEIGIIDNFVQLLNGN